LVVCESPFGVCTVVVVCCSVCAFAAEAPKHSAIAAAEIIKLLITILLLAPFTTGETRLHG
jgi:hypothetical protein